MSACLLARQSAPRVIHAAVLWFQRTAALWRPLPGIVPVQA